LETKPDQNSRHDYTLWYIRRFCAKIDQNGEYNYTIWYIQCFCAYLGTFAGVILTMNDYARSELFASYNYFFAIAVNMMLSCVFPPRLFAWLGSLFIIRSVEAFEKYRDTFVGCIMVFVVSLIISFLINRFFLLRW
jgi:hypothetical protein